MFSLKNHVGVVVISSSILIAGSTSASLAALTWTRRADTSPPARQSTAMAYDSARGRVVLFGGAVSGPFGRDDTWEWDGSEWTNPMPNPHPPGTYGHAMAYDSARGRVVLFGWGILWEWDGAQWSQPPHAHSPSNRVYTAMAYDSARGQVVLFGGNDNSLRNDTWAWDGSDWTEMPISGSWPSPRGYHSMAYDSARGRVVLFGGADSSGRLSDIWEWDGAHWSERNQPPQANTPIPRDFPAMAYDSARGRIVLFGGEGNQGDTGDTWEWDGATWTPSASTISPEPRYLHSMAYDSARERIVLFGGVQSSPALVFSDTWEYPGCGAFVDRSGYGRLLFPPTCTGDASALTVGVYRSTLLGMYKGSGDTFYLSSSGGVADGPTLGIAFAPLVVDDAVYVNTTDSGLGPYDPVPGAPPTLPDTPIDSYWMPLPAKDVTSLIPTGPSSVLFELRNTGGPIFGSTAVYLVKDCGLGLTGKAPTSMNWISHEVEVDDASPGFEARTGLLSMLRADHDFSRASCLGPFPGSPAPAPQSNPPVGDGYYYLLRGLNSCVSERYGHSGLVPDPRDSLANCAP